MSRPTMTLAGAAAILVALVAGCGENVGGTPIGAPPGTSPASGTSQAPSTSPPPTTSGSPSTTPTTTTPSRPAVPKQCDTGDLSVSLGETEGTAGTIYRALVFTNTSKRTCVIQGFPGVSFVAGDDGHQVGAAAAWIGRKGPAVTLKATGTATAPLGFTDIGVYDPAECQPTSVRGLRVYPPHNTAAKFVPFPTTACAGTTISHHLKVLTVHPGSRLG